MLRAPLKDRADGQGQLDLPGDSLGEVLRELERRYPRLEGWVLDEHGTIRRHVNVFVNGERGREDTSVVGRRARPRLAVDLRREPIMTELLVGSKKGLFVLRGEPGEPFDIAARAFPGDVVEYGTRDPRTGRYFASVTSGFYGPRLMYTDDPTGEWEQAKGPAFPEDIPDTSLDRIWIVQPGEADGVLYAGVAPAALFTSTDSGETWELNRSLWNVPTRPEWNPGAGGLALHSICPWPGDPQRLAVGISRGGRLALRGRRRDVADGLQGIGPPVRARGGAGEHARALRAQHASCARSGPSACSCSSTAACTGPTTRARRGTTSRRDSRRGSGSRMAIDPSDPDNAYVIPLTADVDRVTPEGKVRVFETRDAGGQLDRAGRRAARRTMPTSRSCGRRSVTTAARRSGCSSGPRRVRCSARPTREPRGTRCIEHLAPVTSVRVSA